MKFVDVKEVFAEIPDEITLAISISGCPVHCKGCHSKYLWADVGEELNTDVLSTLLAEHIGVSCICFMGGDQDPAEINRLARWVKENSRVSVAWYSGRDAIDPSIEPSHFDYIKIGRYDAEQGPLNQKTTNQRLWRVLHEPNGHRMEDITPRFWK